MNREQAFDLFEEMIRLAQTELRRFTQSQKLSVDQKADKTVVTACDYHLDRVLSEFATSQGMSVVSEEGKQEKKIVKSGNYLTIDPIDGSLGYIEHVNYALQHGGITTFLSKDLGPASDFCLLVGIVENGSPRYGCCFHYITHEKWLLDAESPDDCVIKHTKRRYACLNAIYVDPRPGEEIQQQISEVPDVTAIQQATLGLKSLYTVINKHENAITIHRVQRAGLWDILPTAVAIKAFGGRLLDDSGDEVVYDKYVILPGKGATCIKGNRFLYVKDELKRNQNCSH